MNLDFPDLRLLARILRVGDNTPYAKLLTIAEGAVRRSDELALSERTERPQLQGMGVEGIAKNAATQDEMPHVGPRTRAESRSSRQHEAVTPPASAAPVISSDKEQTFSPRRELLILMQKEPNGATRIRVEDQRDGSLLVERTAFGFEEALFARLQEAKEVSSAKLPSLEPARVELECIVKAPRYDRKVFADDTEFAEWVLSRCRHTLSQYVNSLSPTEKK